MKRWAFFLLFAFIFIALPSSAIAAEQVISFDAELDIQKNGNIEVKETIKYDFGDDNRHGIYRDIPLGYRTGTTTENGEVFGITISNISVSNEDNNPRSFVKEGDSYMLRIRVGDPDKYITGEQIYVINYTVRGALLSYYLDIDALRWDVTGNEWKVPIKKVSAYVKISEGEEGQQMMQYDCYEGRTGSTERCKWEKEGLYKANYESTRTLNAGEGITIFAGFDKGMVATPYVAPPIPPSSGTTEGGNTQKKEPKSFIYYLILFTSVPFITFVTMMYLWYTRGRDPEGRVSIVPQYEPPEGLTPEEAGIIHDEHFENRDLIAAILGLASTGYIKIHHQKIVRRLLPDSEDYILERVSNDRPADSFRRQLLDYLYCDIKYEKEVTINSKKIKGIPVKDLRKFFPQKYRALQKIIYREITQKGYFISNPEKARTWYMIFGWIILIIAGLLSEIFVMSSFFWVALILPAIIIILFGRKMSARTKKGVLAKEYILGFKNFLKTAQKDRISFHAGPESVRSGSRDKTPQEFFDLLPYAIALGVEKEWAKQFENMTMEEPKWYATGSSVHMITAGVFLSDFNKFSAKTTQGFTTGSSGSGAGGFSSGGGFSGGGVGGGGGGSW